jgi:hypothetical protein
VNPYNQANNQPANDRTELTMSLFLLRASPDHLFWLPRTRPRTILGIQFPNPEHSVRKRLYSRIVLRGEQISHSPNVLGDTRFHRRSTSDRRMDSHKVVVGEVQRERRFQVLPLLAKADGQTGKAPHGRANVQVLSFQRVMCKFFQGLGCPIMTLRSIL